MNIYDTANKLAQEIKTSEEYMNYKMARELIDLNASSKAKIKEFEQSRYEVQLEVMQTGKENQEKIKAMQDIYSEIIDIPEVQKYFDAELKFNVMLADINKIISQSVEELIK